MVYIPSKVYKSRLEILVPSESIRSSLSHTIHHNSLFLALFQGDPEASFTKEHMHAGKHQEYEKKLHEDLLVRTKVQSGQGADAKISTSTQKGVKDGATGVSRVLYALNICY